jgi:hypothetical protein
MMDNKVSVVRNFLRFKLPDEVKFHSGFVVEMAFRPDTHGPFRAPGVRVVGYHDDGLALLRD